MSTSTLARRRGAGAVDEVEVDIDPRIADRRSAVQREHRHKRRRLLIILSVVTAMVLGGVALTRSAALDVDHIDVVGADRTSVEGLIGASGLSVGAPMTELDLDGARAAIAGLPWIADVRMKRQWPNRVAIAVRERVPVAAVPTTDGQWGLVDESGQVLTVAQETSDRWVRIEGLQPAEGIGTTLTDDAADPLAVALALPADLKAGLDRIVRNDRGELELHFDTGPRALLDGIAELPRKLDALQAVFDQVDDCGIDLIDLRAELVAVTRVPACRAEAATDPTLTDAVDAGAGEGLTTDLTTGVPPDASGGADDG